MCTHVRGAAGDDGDNDPDVAAAGTFVGDTTYPTAMQVCNAASETYLMPAYQGDQYLGYFQDAGLDVQYFNLATRAVAGDAIHIEFMTNRLNAGWGGTVFTLFDDATPVASVAESWNGWYYYNWGGSWYDDYQVRDGGQGKLVYDYNVWQKVELDWVVGNTDYLYVSLDGDQKVMSATMGGVTGVTSLRFMPWNGASWAAYDSVPEPMTIGLLTLGGAVALRRRK